MNELIDFADLDLPEDKRTVLARANQANYIARGRLQAAAFYMEEVYKAAGLDFSFCRDRFNCMERELKFAYNIVKNNNPPKKKTKDPVK